MTKEANVLKRKLRIVLGAILAIIMTIAITTMAMAYDFTYTFNFFVVGCEEEWNPAIPGATITITIDGEIVETLTSNEWGHAILEGNTVATFVATISLPSGYILGPGQQPSVTLAFDGTRHVNIETLWVVVPAGDPPPQPTPTPAPTPQPPPTDTTILNPHSTWARAELERAAELDLIPTSLQSADVDLRDPINRVEFAGVVVQTFQALTQTAALPTIVNPFTDTRDPYALRAFNTGLMVGVSETRFDPYALLTREMAATALTRVFKRATIPTWTFATDADYPLDFEWPALFADDAHISSWARESVYFMVANGIILGTGNNMFSPRAVTTAQQARGYATATREQALIIALRMVENLG